MLIVIVAVLLSPTQVGAPNVKAPPKKPMTLQQQLQLKIAAMQLTKETDQVAAMDSAIDVKMKADLANEANLDKQKTIINTAYLNAVKNADDWYAKHMVESQGLRDDMKKNAKDKQAYDIATAESNYAGKADNIVSGGN